MFSGIQILDSCIRAWGEGKHLELNAEHMLKLLIRKIEWEGFILLPKDNKPWIKVFVIFSFYSGLSCRHAPKLEDTASLTDSFVEFQI